jgi:CHAD domain-containing protein
VPQDPERVHQLRVASRRAAAALRTFKSCLAKKAHRRARKQVRRVRRVAGAARDWDVLLAQSSERLQRADLKNRPGLEFLIGYACGQRVAAQKPLHEATETAAASWDSFTRRTLAAIHRHSSRTTLGDLAGQELNSLIRELAEAAGRDLERYEHLHHVRILGKRLRYTIEILAGCFAAPLRAVYYPAVEEMQEILGTANDSHQGSLQLEQICNYLRCHCPEEWPQFEPGLMSLLRHHERRLQQQRRKFTEWWDKWQKSVIADLMWRIHVCDV